MSDVVQSRSFWNLVFAITGVVAIVILVLVIWFSVSSATPTGTKTQTTTLSSTDTDTTSSTETATQTSTQTETSVLELACTSEGPLFVLASRLAPDTPHYQQLELVADTSGSAPLHNPGEPINFPVISGF
jgi:hypothetical protein